MQAIKEWAVVCKALEEGRQILLLRKGGIMEYRQGFEIKHDEFLLFPTFEHQTKESLKADYADALDATLRDAPQGGTNTITCIAKVVEVKEVSDRAVLRRLDKYHIWNDIYVNARMDYNPKKPMSVVMLRVYKLVRPISVDVKPEWAGCKSWIPIESAGIIENNGTPVLEDSYFDKVSGEVREVLN